MYCLILLQILQDSEKRRKTSSKNLRESLHNSLDVSSMRFERKILVIFPSNDDHNHPTGQVNFISIPCNLWILISNLDYKETRQKFSFTTSYVVADPSFMGFKPYLFHLTSEIFPQ